MTRTTRPAASGAQRAPRTPRGGLLRAAAFASTVVALACARGQQQDAWSSQTAVRSSSMLRRVSAVTSKSSNSHQSTGEANGAAWGSAAATITGGGTPPRLHAETETALDEPTFELPTDFPPLTTAAAVLPITDDALPAGPVPAEATTESKPRSATIAPPGAATPAVVAASSMAVQLKTAAMTPTAKPVAKAAAAAAAAAGVVASADAVGRTSNLRVRATTRRRMMALAAETAAKEGEGAAAAAEGGDPEEQQAQGDSGGISDESAKRKIIIGLIAIGGTAAGLIVLACSVAGYKRCRAACDSDGPSSAKKGLPPAKGFHKKKGPNPLVQDRPGALARR